ncbi:MAG: ATP synthase F1 subunit epsilon [Planctomycetales bacterium 4484_113]|nr:MAG: ATP synthase F1 subunit epsilon [Planctomycetales bacterium 4484_113]
MNENDRSFPVKLVSPDGELYTARAISLVVPVIDGYLGVLKHHAPMVAALDFGELLIRTPEEHIVSLAVAGGFMEVTRKEVIILCDAAEFREDIDITEATKQLRAARERLQKKFSGVELERAQVALREAENRLKVARHKERKHIVE